MKIGLNAVGCRSQAMEVAKLPTGVSGEVLLKWYKPSKGHYKRCE